MTDQTPENQTFQNQPSQTTSTANPPSPPSSRPGRCRSRRKGGKAIVMIALLGSFLAGGVVFSKMNAFSEDGPGLMQRMHWMPGADRPQPPAPPTPEQRIEHGRFMLDMGLTRIEATSDQKAKILAIYDATAAQLKDAPVKVFQDRLALVTLLTAPTIDHDKLEALRASAIGDLDGASKILTKALADAGDVLTPTQRTRLAMLMERPPHGPRPEHGPMANAHPVPPAAPAPAPAP